MINVVCAIFENNGKILICRRREGVKNEGKWEFPGGKVISGESMLKALRREIKEELGIEIKVSRKIASLSGIEGKFKLLAYECKPLSLISESSDHDQLEWVKKENLLEYDLLDGDRMIIKYLVENGFLTNEHPELDQNGRVIK